MGKVKEGREKLFAKHPRPYPRPCPSGHWGQARREVWFSQAESGAGRFSDRTILPHWFD